MTSSNHQHACPKDLLWDSAQWEEIKMNLPPLNKAKLKPYSMKELSTLYKVSVPRFKRMLSPYKHQVGIQVGHYYTISQVRRIFICVDAPTTYTTAKLACTYGVSIPKMRDWLDDLKGELGERSGHYFSIRQLFVIIVCLDIPRENGKDHEDFVQLLNLIKPANGQS
jgi:hypothetical protein